MRTNHLHQIIVNEDDVIEVLYRDDQVNNIIVENHEWVDQYNNKCKEFELPCLFDWADESMLSESEFVKQNLADWNLPNSYLDFNLERYLIDKCKDETQIKRVQDELIEFKKRDMVGVLIWLKYFVDTLRKNNLIWGVGRGSSVSSYILFLLGVHKIDSLKYNLDIKEFLK